MQILPHIKVGNGIPFVCQHGLGAKSIQIKKLLQPLKNIELICMDCPGHGDAPLIESVKPSFNYYGDLLIGLLDQLNIREAVFGGISMGAGIALNIARRFPNRVLGLVLIRPAWLDQANPENLSVLLEASKSLRNNNIDGFKVNDSFKEIASKHPDAGASLLGLFEPEQQSCLPLVLESMVHDRPFAELDELKAIKNPCLIIGNQDDPLHPFDMAEAVHQKIEGSKLSEVISRYVDDSEHTKIVNQLILRFIQSNEEQLESRRS